MEVGNIEEIRETRVDPADPGKGLTLGTVAIATRVVPHDLGPTLVALRHVAPQGRRATRLDGLHHPQLLPREAMCSAIGVAVGAKDIGDFGSGPGAGLGVGVATHGAGGLPAVDEQIGGHRGVDGAHEALLDRPNPCGPGRSQTRRHTLSRDCVQSKRDRG